jgi:WD40 repeat protein
MHALSNVHESTHRLLVWEWQSETYVLKQQGHFYDVNALAYSPDGQLIATGGEDGKVKLWNASSGFCFVTFSDHSGPVSVWACAHSLDHRRVVFLAPVV